MLYSEPKNLSALFVPTYGVKDSLSWERVRTYIWRYNSVNCIIQAFLKIGTVQSNNSCALFSYKADDMRQTQMENAPLPNMVGPRPVACVAVQESLLL